MLTVAGLVAVFGLVGPQPASAVHDTGAFELEGNATNDPAVAGDDWDNVCHEVLGADCSTTSDTSGATAVSWVADGSLNATIFTGGGSKDPQDITQWAWKDGAGGLPDKDNLLHSFAARYSLTPSATCPSGGALTCDVLYFGSDRYDNSGDAQQGFWFLQDQVALGTGSLGGGTRFSGVHVPGDLLVISDFSNGGNVSTIRIFVWDPTVSGNLRLLDESSAANCGTAGTADPFCGIVNPNNGTTAPWSFTDKSGNSTYLQGEFFEGGINLSLLGLADECFSSIVSETRSSTSTTATLKDFVIGEFDVCVPEMDTDASTSGPVTPGTAVHDTATITVVGATTPDDPTGTVTFFLCGPIATGDCSTGGTNVGTGALNGGADLNDGVAVATSPDVNTPASATGNLSPGRYCFRAEWPGDANYPDALSFTNATDECFTVKDVSAITTAQKWLPQDTATVTNAGGTAVSGTVVFSLYENGTCSGTAARTFTDTTAPFETNNATYATTSTIISWSATFTPTDPDAVQGSTTTQCERSDLTINNSASVFPPGP
jgi:hypothetical protein